MSKIINKILQEGFLQESKNIGILYHFTSLHGIEGILKQNMIRSKLGDWQNKKTGTYMPIYGFSTTRDKNFHKTADRNEAGISGTSVRITLNGNKISERYKIKPFNYRPALSTRHDMTESEEFVIIPKKQKGLSNIKNYIIKIDILPEQIKNFELKGKIKIEYLKFIFDLIKQNNIPCYIDEMWFEYFNELENEKNVL